VQIQKALDSNQKRLGEAAHNEETDSIEENEKLLQSTYQGIQRVLARIRDLAPADLSRADESGPPWVGADAVQAVKQKPARCTAAWWWPAE
jgi:hypothetical protein